MVKLIYGIGCFVFMNMGKMLVGLKNWMLIIIVYCLNGEMIYVLEGLIFVVGVVV